MKADLVLLEIMVMFSAVPQTKYIFISDLLYLIM